MEAGFRKRSCSDKQVELAIPAQTFFHELSEIGIPARVLLVAKRVQVIPGEDAGIMEIVEGDAYGIIADRLDLEDGDVALARNGDALLRRMPLHFRRRRGDTQQFRRQFERLMAGKGDREQLAVLRDPEFLRRRHDEIPALSTSSLRC